MFKYFFFLILFFTSCHENNLIFLEYWYSAFSYLDYPPVFKEKDAQVYGDTVYVMGIYRIDNIRRRPHDSPIQKVGIQLFDQQFVYLYPFTDKRSTRPKHEIQTFEKRYVKVKGIIYPFIPDSQLDASCLVEVFDIEILD